MNCLIGIQARRKAFFLKDFLCLIEEYILLVDAIHCNGRII